MKLFQIVFILSIVGSLICYKNDSSNHSHGKKRFVVTVPALIGGALVAGANIAGTTAKSLRYDTFISTSGIIDNYSKWTMQLQRCTMVDGYMNVPLRSIHPGFREAFATHYVPTPMTADVFMDLAGSNVYCKLVANTGKEEYLIYIHFDVPHSAGFNPTPNSLGFAVCSKTDEECRSLKAEDIKKRKYPYTGYREYQSSTAHIYACGDILCLEGIMGTSHKTNIDLKIYPKKYEKLSSAVSKQTKNELKKDNYENHIKFLEEEAKRK